MESSEYLSKLADRLSAKRVYSDPIQQDGITLITAAAVRGGGGRQRNGRKGQESGSGMGLGARPVGAYVIQGSTVKWKPALDMSRLIFRGQIIALTVLLVAGLLLTSRRH